MPLRLIPIAVIIMFALLLALGSLHDEDNGRAKNDFDWSGGVAGVDGVLDDALSDRSFDVLRDSVTGTAEDTEERFGDAFR